MVELHGARIILREKRLEDAEQDYIWRSDPELARLDAAYPLTMSYDRYLKIFQDLPFTEVTAVCDHSADRMLKAQKSHAAVKSYTDYNEMMRDPEIDAVAVVTPDHQAVIMFVDQPLWWMNAVYVAEMAQAVSNWAI